MWCGVVWCMQVDVGVYSQEKIGVAIPRGWDNVPKHSTRTDLLKQRRVDALPPQKAHLADSLTGVRACMRALACAQTFLSSFVFT